jgi:RNA polymerase sigma-70 factor (ECF subfamily)
MREEALPALSSESTLYEADLAERAKARSPEAWTEIYKAHHATIYRYVKARVFDEATAEDLTSAVFLGALKGIDSYKFRGRPLLAWLYTIARNVVASHQRDLLKRPMESVKRGLDLPFRAGQSLMRRARGQDDEASDLDLLPDSSADGDPARLVDRLDLRDALAKLPESQREVVVLRFFAGLSAQEVAEITGKGPDAVYSLQARAIVALREHLK